MKELIDWECCCIFNLPYNEWPIPGAHAWVVVLKVDGNMIKLASRFDPKREEAFWCNTSIIKTITKFRPCPPTQ